MAQVGVRPEGKLDAYHPAERGVLTALPLTREWRPDETWQQRGTEYVQPLGALAPVADVGPRSMYYDTTAWTPQGVADELATAWWTDTAHGNGHWMETYTSISNASGQRPQFLAYVDSTVYTSATGAFGQLESPSIIHENFAPNFAWHILPWSPPQNQAVPCAMSLSFPATRRRGGSWSDDGRISLNIPVSIDLFPDPFWHWISDEEIAETASWNVFEHGEQLATIPFGRMSSTNMVGQWMCWLCEYVTSPDLFDGCHLLLRCAPNNDAWHHLYLPDLEFFPRPGIDPWYLTIQGFSAITNVTLPRYGDSISMPSGATVTERKSVPRYPLAKPPVQPDSGNVYAAEPEYSHLASLPMRPAIDDGDPTPIAGWEVSVVADPDMEEQEMRPEVAFKRTSAEQWHLRPYLWVVYEDYAPTYGEADSTTYTTDSANRLTKLTYSINSEWRMARGSAEFVQSAADFVWPQGSRVEVTLGWDDSADAALRATKVATAYIMPGGVTVDKDGERSFGIAKPGLQLGDYFAAHLPNKQIFDARQAAGWTVVEWIGYIADRLNLDYTVAAECAAWRIPTDPIPSRPAFPASDGGFWHSHMTEVCDALNLRWGFDKTAAGELFVDMGRPYYAGTPDFIFDEDTTTEKDQVFVLKRGNDRQGLATILKIITGHSSDYHFDTLTDRAASGLDWSAVLSGESAADPTAILAKHWRQYRDHAETLTWTGPLRVDLRPDKFVLMSDPPANADVDAGSVWQIIEHEMMCDAVRGEATSTITAVEVQSA